MKHVYKLLVILFFCLPVFSQAQDSCRADFTVANGNNAYTKTYTSVLWHSSFQFPTQICWKFGDGQDTCINAGASGILGGSIITHNYAQPGNYNVCIKITYMGGCVAEHCKDVPVALTNPNDSCNANYTVVPGGNSYAWVFTPVPSHNNNKPVTQIMWNWDDGSISTQNNAQPATHYYPQSGIYNICETITYEGGCQSTICKPLTVTIPDSCFAYFTDTTVPGTAVTKRFTALGDLLPNNKPIREVCWKFGDGRDTCIQYDSLFTGLHNVVHNYTQPGLYNVCVKIRFYSSNCISEYCRNVQVGNTTPADSCKADFTVAPGNAPFTRSFTPQPWHNNQKPVTEVRWTFGDNSPPVITATATTVSHTFPQAGNYNVCVRIKYDGGCISEKCKIVTIAGTTPDSCKADFRDSSLSINLYKVFTPLPSHSNNKPVIEVKWTFGDGNTAITPNATPVYHYYGNSGVYNVCVRIKYEGGCIAEKCRTVNAVVPDTCRADFEMLQAASNSLARTFIALPSHTSYNGIAKPYKICWKFGDGRDTCINYDTTYTGSYTVQHTYANTGTYNACVKIYYSSGCVAEKCKPVTIGTIVVADSCKANFEVLSTAGSVLSKTFVAQPWHSNGKRPEKICWTFGDGQDTCITYNPGQVYNYFVNHTYLQPGVYTVCVKIKYQGGCEAQFCKPVTVGVVIPADTCHAEFAVTHFNSSAYLKKFTALPWHNNNKKPERICWIFGDGRDTCINYNPGNPNNDYSVLHTYTGNGLFTVCVKIKYQGGCEKQWCKQVAVGVNTTPDTCKALFIQQPVQNNVLWRQFKAIPWHSLQKRPYKICWVFGDGRDTCINYNPAVNYSYIVNHLYNQPGTYNVCVKIWYEGGCYAQYCQPVAIVVPPCRALFTDSMISRFKVKFKGQAIVTAPNDPVISWNWTFGDGSAGSGQNVIHEYAQPGTYNVCLKIKTASGCENTFCKPKVIDSSIHILRLMPNPVQNTLFITYYSFQNELAQIKIYNIYGILVKSFSRQMLVGYNNFSTDVSTLSPGPYSLVVQTPTTITSSVFFKQ
jgi:PKD repeat protein